MSRLDKETQRVEEPKRIAYAKTKLAELGYEIEKETDNMIAFTHSGERVMFYPYSGWHTGKSIKDGRGIKNLLAQLTAPEAKEMNDIYKKMALMGWKAAQAGNALGKLVSVFNKLDDKQGLLTHQDFKKITDEKVPIMEKVKVLLPYHESHLGHLVRLLGNENTRTISYLMKVI